MLKRQTLPDKIKMDKGKISIPAFSYKKQGEKEKTNYPAKKLVVPDKPGNIVRIYLDKDDQINTNDGPEHELILGEILIPLTEYEQIEEKGEFRQIRKELDLNSLQVINYEIPERS